MVGQEYIHIVLKDKGVVVNTIDHSKTLELIKNNGLILATPDSYLGDYDESLGRIYTTSNFQTIINNNPGQKEQLYNILNNV